MHSFKNYILFILLFVFLQDNLYAQLCGCTACPVDIAVGTTGNVNFEVSGASINTDLGGSQSVCGVTIDFSPANILGIEMTLTSPAGQSVELVGPNSTGAGSVLSTFDIDFVRCADNAVPDTDVLGNPFEAQWINNQMWPVNGTIMGTYYPFNGCLEDFNAGSVNGNWVLTVTNNNSTPTTQPIFINDFFPIFCEDVGIDCDPCDAFGGDLSAYDDIQVCEDDPELIMPLNPVFPDGQPDPLEYAYRFAIGDQDDNNTILEYQSVFDMSDYDPGSYTICGFSILVADIGNLGPFFIPPDGPDGMVTLGDLNNFLAGPNPPVCGDLSDDCFQIDIFPVPQNPSIAPPDIIPCSGTQSIRLEGTLPLGNPPFTWSAINGGTLGADQNTLMPEALTPGTYILEIMFPASICVGADTVEVVADTNIPVANATTPDLLSCANGAVELNGSGSTGSTLFLEWFDVLSGNSVGIGPTIMVDEQGEYRLVVTSGLNNCADSTIVEVFGDLDTPVAMAPMQDTISCNSTSVLLDGTMSTGGNSYEWFDSGGILISATETFSITTPDTYQLIVTNTTNDCKDTTFTNVLEFLDMPTATIAMPIDTLNCENALVVLDGSMSTSVNSEEYCWINPSGDIISQSQIHQVSIPGEFTLVVKDQVSGCTDSTMVDVQIIDAVPTAISEINGTINCQQDEVVITSVSVGVNDLSIQWNNAFNIFLTDQDTFIVTDTDFYNLVVFDEISGCSDTMRFRVMEDIIAPIPDAVVNGMISCTNAEVVLDGSGTIFENMGTFEWFDPDNNIVSTTNSYTASIAGQYKLIVTDTVNFCVDSLSFNVEGDASEIEAIAFPETDTLNCINTEVILDGSNSMGPPNIVFEWQNFAGTTISMNAMHPVSDPDTYRLIVSLPDGTCSDSTLVVIEDNRLFPNASAIALGEITCTQDFVILNGTGSTVTGPGPLGYQWFDPIGIPLGTASTDTAFNAGTYILVVEDIGVGCTDTTEVLVQQFADVPVAVIDSIGQLDCINSTLVLDGSNSIITGTASYTWTDLTTMTVISQMPSVNIFQAGLYELTVKDIDNDCESSTSIAINDTALPTSTIALSDSITCDQVSVELIGAASIGTGLLSYTWLNSSDQNIGISQNITVTDPGIYRLIIGHELNTCTDTSSIEVVGNLTPPVAVSGMVNNFVTCASPPAALSPLGASGQGDLFFEWLDVNGDFFGDDPLELTRIPGDYTLIVTDDANGCKDTAIINVPGNIIPPEAIAAATGVSCDASQLALNGLGSSGQGSLGYTWQDTFGVFISSSISTSVDSSATYVLIVTDSENGCMDTTTVSFADTGVGIEAIAVASNELDCENSIVTLDASMSVSQNPLFYEWSNPSGIPFTNSEQVQVMDAGEYTLVIFEPLGGCFDTTTVEVNQAVNSVDADIQVSDEGGITCAIPTIQLDGSNSGGTNLQYVWKNAAGIEVEQGPIFIANSPNMYQLIVTDTITNCMDSTTHIVTLNLDEPVANAFVLDTLNCSQSSVLLDGSGSFSPDNNGIEFQWFDNLENPLGTNSTAQATAPGTYQIVVTDTVSTCTDTATVVVIQSSDQPNAVITFEENLSCVNEEVILDGQLSSQSGQWTDEFFGDLGSTPTLSVTTPGIYRLILQDINSMCSDTATVEVDQYLDEPVAVAEVVSIISCMSDEITLDGNASTTTGTALLYEWQNGIGTIIGNNPIEPTNGLDIYTLIVTDSLSGCVDSAFVTPVIDTIPPEAIAVVFDSLSCALDSVSISGFPPAQPANYEWRNSANQVIGTDMNVMVGDPGFYGFLVTNIINGCTDSISVEVFESDNNVNAVIELPDSLGCGIAEVTLDGSNSLGDNLEYAWRGLDGSIIGVGSTQPVSEIGVYTLLVTDATMTCSDSTTIEVFSGGGSVVATIEPPATLGCGIENIMLDGSNSQGDDLIYTWRNSDNVVIGMNATITVSEAGVYTLLITDENMTCADSTMIEVEGGGGSVSAIADASGVFDCDTNEITLDATGSSDGVTFLWKDDAENQIGMMSSTTVDEPGIYTLVVTSGDGACIDSTEVVVEANPGTLIPVATASDILSCDIGEVVLDGSMSSGAMILNYEWQNEFDITIAEDVSTTVDNPGIYTLFISSENGICLDSIDIEVMQSADQPTAIITFDNHLNCNNEFTTLNSELSSQSGQWTDAAFGDLGSTPTLQVSTPGIYYLILQDVNSMCSDTTSFEVLQFLEEPIAMAQIDATITCVSNEIILDGSASTSTNSTLFYEWQNGTGGIIGNNSIETTNGFDTYNLIVTDSLSECVDNILVIPMLDTIPPIAMAEVLESLSCALDSISIEGISPAQPANYEWRNSANQIIGTNLNVTVGDAGFYGFLVTDANNGCTDSISVEVLETDNNVNADIEVSGTLGCSNPNVILNGSNSNGENLIYTWRNFNGVIIGMDQTTTVTEGGFYTLLVTDENMTCQDSVTVEVFGDGSDVDAIANASGDFNCDTGEIILDATGSSDDVSYFWKDASGNQVGDMLTTTVDTPGTYTLIVTSFIGACIDSTEVIVQANPGNLFPVATASDTLSCEVGEVLLDGSMSSGGINLNYEWQNAANVIISANSSTMVNDPGIYTLLVSSENGVCLDSVDVEVVQSDNSILAIGTVGDLLTCNTQSVNLDGSGSTGGAILYEWFDPNGVSIGMNAMANATTPGTHKLIVSNFLKTCIDSTTVEVMSNFEFPAAFVSAFDDLSCADDTTALDLSFSSGIGDLAFNWFADDFTILSFTESVEVMEPGIYIGVVTDVDTGCADTLQVQVDADFEAPIGAVEIQGGFGCGMNDALLIGSSSINASDYQWFDDSNSLIGLTDSQQVFVPEDYTLIVTSQNNGCTDTLSIDLNTSEQPIFAVTSVDGIIDCNNNMVTLSGDGSSLGNNVTYNWFDPQNNFLSEEISETVTIGGEYWLVVSNGMCSDTSFINVVDAAQDLPEAIISGPDVLTINCGDVLILDGTTTPINDTLIATWSPMSSINSFADSEMLQPIVGTTGWIFLSVLNTNTGCIGVDSLLIQNFQSAISAGPDTLICGEDYMLNADLPSNNTGIWTLPDGLIIDDPTDPSSFVSGFEAGQSYELIWTISADGCEDFATASVFISTEDAPTAIDDEIQFDGGFSPFFFNITENDVFLQPEDGYNIISDPNPGTVSDEGNGDIRLDFDELFNGTVLFEYELCNSMCPNLCDSASVSIQIDSLDISTIDIDIPNAITPNDDGINDELIIDFILASPDEFPDNELIIFNRWGDAVFRAKPYQNNWDGSNETGFPLPDGTYYYLLNLDLDNGLIFKGDITILR